MIQSYRLEETQATSDNGASTRVARDRGLEILSATLMALATVLAAWCAYQATRWDGIHSPLTPGAVLLTTAVSESDTIPPGAAIPLPVTALPSVSIRPVSRTSATGGTPFAPGGTQ
jgi:hypothetical protein